MWGETERRCGLICWVSAMAGERRPAVPDPFDGFEPYVRQRLADDPHVWGTALFDETRALGYGQSYVTFVREGP